LAKHIWQTTEDNCWDWALGTIMGYISMFLIKKTRWDVSVIFYLTYPPKPSPKIITFTQTLKTFYRSPISLRSRIKAIKLEPNIYLTFSSTVTNDRGDEHKPNNDDKIKCSTERNLIKKINSFSSQYNTKIMGRFLNTNLCCDSFFATW